MVELQLRDRLVGAGAGADPPGGDGLGVGVGGDRVPVCWKSTSASTRAAVSRLTVWPTPKLVAVRGLIQPCFTVQRIWLPAQKLAGRR